MANNKHHDRIIRIFNQIHKKYSNYELHIIGTIQTLDWYKYLENIKNGNIYIHPNLKDVEKQNILTKADYIIHAAGMDENESINPFVFEHFGISIIEGLEKKCIPICTNGGFPKHYIKHEENGYLFKDGNDLYNVIDKILGRNTILDFKRAIDNNDKIVDKYTYKNYCSNLASILLTI
jgi:glycosyltransferase involved in cell wall biosynthesis